MKDDDIVYVGEVFWTANLDKSNEGAWIPVTVAISEQNANDKLTFSWSHLESDHLRITKYKKVK